jgi:16S rRNA (guanine1207-N2)-methyltransferase
MSADRLNFALHSGGLTLPDGPIALFGAQIEDASPDIDLPRCDVIQTSRPTHDAWGRYAARVLTAPEGPYAGAIVTTSRARDLTEARVAQAVKSAPNGLIVVNGAKTDGVEPIIKALKKRYELLGQVSKAHGKCIWFQADSPLTDWELPAMACNPQGDYTAPGVFSADGADPASQALAAALPDKIKGAVGDLGAGWGWLSREILKRDGVKALHAVEAEKTALDCAEANLNDPRVRFHWADATTWMSPQMLDAVVMNPPFHTGRKADPDLGKAFIRSAAKNLAPQGQLWLVANRHLPYEPTLTELFREVKEIGGDNRFKILNAARPSRLRS